MRIVLTIARERMKPAASIAAGLGISITNKASTDPAMVIGTPWKEEGVLDTLNLASRKAPHKVKRAKHTSAAAFQVPSKVLYKRTEGATPKETRSARESNSLPKAETALQRRARMPSARSVSAARTIRIALKRKF